MSIKDQQPAVTKTIQNLAERNENLPDIEFSSQEWKRIGQVIKILRPFEEATKELSQHDASISLVIPNITAILQDLEEEEAEDVGVLTMKRALKHAMEHRFREVEQNVHYACATILDRDDT